MAKLLNYTTQVPARTSIEQIQHQLMTHGARKILIENDGSSIITGITFEIPTAIGDVIYRLPARIDNVFELLVKQRNYRSSQQEKAGWKKNREQAYRTAWRILKDWVEAQLAIIDAEMVSVDEVFLPYAITKGGVTMYDRVMNDGAMLLGDGR